MAKLTKLIFLVLILLGIFTQSILSQETGVAHDHDLEEEHDHDHDNDHNHEHEQEQEEDIQGNLLDEGGIEILASLGFDKKESLNKNEMKTLYEKVFYKREITDSEEKEFYNKIIENVVAALPEEVQLSEIRNYFDVQYLMKYIEEGVPANQPEDEPQDTSKDSL